MERRFDQTNARLAGIETTVDTLVDDKQVSNQRLARIEVRMDKMEERADQSSIRAREESGVNLQQDAAIAQILTTVEDLKKRPDTAAIVLEKVTELGKTPTGQKIIGALVTVLLLALTFLAASLQRKVDALEERPTTVQPAPTVYLPVAAPPAPANDGGAP
ncbi:MAG: hypothetical protein KF894_29625 [Labilithrix sp.]|nr:hypothetical protein [Labilithrix sp.]